MSEDMPTLGGAPRFVCDLAADDDHDTVPVFIRCLDCRQFVIAGYECDTCGHESVARQLAGHGPGLCT